MNISVVIPVYNAKDTILPCLKSLNEQEELPSEVILVDNNSTDGTVELVRSRIADFKNLKLIIEHERKKGPAAARNKGITAAGGDIIAFTDSDCMAGKDWIKNIKKQFDEDPGLDAIGGIENSVFSDSTLIGQFLSAFWLAPLNSLRRTLISGKEDFLNGLYVCTFNCAFKKKVLNDINGFDESFCPAGEDIDLWMRALANKAKIMTWDFTMAVSHKQNISFIQLLRKTFAYGEAFAHLAKKHFRNKIIFQMPVLGQYKFDSNSTSFVMTLPFAKLSLAATGVGAFSLVSFKAGATAFIAMCVYLFFDLKLSIVRKGYTLSLRQSLLVMFVFIARELAEQSGRLFGSLKYGVICV